MSTSPNISIPEDVALKICHEIQEQNRARRLSTAKVQCWGCQLAAKKDARRMCIYSKPGNRGCAFVTKVFDQQGTHKG